MQLPEEVLDVASRIRTAGGRALLVGGALRDHALGGAVRDFDVATSLMPTESLALFPGADAVDARLGTLRLSHAHGSIVLTTFREEGEYRDHRHPSIVRFVREPERDALRRDFTVNAVYLDPLTRELIDPCGGIDDLATGVLRTIGVPTRRFTEDPLRLLRGWRFAASSGLTIESATRAAIRDSAGLLCEISKERIFDELTRGFTGRGRGQGLLLLVELGLAAVVLPEVPPMAGVAQPPVYHPEGDVLTHVGLVLDAVPEADPVLAWSAVLHDVGKPATFERAADRIRFSGHDVLSADMADRALRRLHASNELREIVVEICRDHIRFATLPDMTQRKRERWLRSSRFAAHMAFHRADCLGSHKDLRIYRQAEEWLRQLPPLPPPPLCTGQDVLALGIAEGPLVGVLLRELERRLEAHPDADRAFAVSILVELANPYIRPTA